MKKKFSKSEAKKLIEDFFSNLEDKTKKDIKKIKRFAMKYNLPLKDKRKLFCKKCYNVFNSENSKIRAKKGRKIILCKNCGYTSRWKMKRI